MDPNVTLESLLELINEDCTTEELAYNINEILDLVESLDTWLSKGGFLPERWKR